MRRAMMVPAMIATTRPSAISKRDPHQLVADRRQRLRGRLFEEHVPAELRHRGSTSSARALPLDIGARCQRHAAGLA